ncbi:MAG: leucine-rich repeat domain-containing protein [Alistipes sp.]|nr:leucine-rich repeat domain-containing protein [Alistipes sp.]
MSKKLLCFIAVLAFFACENTDLFEPTNNVGAAKGDFPEVLYAYMADQQDTQTRTYTNGKAVLWQQGDAISYFAGRNHNVKYLYNGAASSSVVEFDKVDATGSTGGLIEFSRGIYPYDPAITVVDEDGIDKISVAYPAAQTYAPNSFGRDANLMVATGKNNQDDELYFRNACGYLVIKLYGDANIKDIALWSRNGTGKIAGPALIVTDEENIPIVTMSDEATTTVTLDCSNDGQGVALSNDSANPTEFWFALPPVTFEEGIRIVVTDMNGRICTKETSNKVAIERNEIQPMSALEFVSNTSTPSQRIYYTKTASAMEGEGGLDPIKFNEEMTNPFDATISGHYFDPTISKFVIEFSSPVKTIMERAFFNTPLQTIELPDGLETIEDLAFGWVFHLSEITIPGSVNTIGVDAFSICYDLSSVTFLPSPTQTPLAIGYQTTPVVNTQQGPFCDSSLEYIYLDRELVYKNSDNEDFYPDEEDEGIFYYEEHDKVESVSVTIGEQVRTIPDFMFSCLNIHSLTIPGTVTTIGNDVFNGCESLTSITFEPSLTGEALTLGYNTENEEDGPFLDSPLTSVNLNREIVYTLANIDLDYDDEGIFSGRPLTDGIVIGEQVRTLYDFMFANSGITSLTIPGTVTTIGNNAFNGCEQLTSITFEPSLTDEALTLGYNTDGEEDSPFLDSPLTSVNLNRNIIYTLADIDLDYDDEGIFYGKPLTDGVTLGEQVRTLYDFMFANSGITSLTIPGSVTNIGNDVFNGCEQLTSITFEPSPTGEALTLGYNTENEEDGPFLDSPLTSVNLNREIIYTLANIDLDYDDEGIFYGKPLTDGVTLGNQVQTLSKYMFANSGITSLIIPGSVVEIADYAFYDCKSLASIRFEGSAEPLTIGFQPGSNEYGPFYQSPLTYIYVNREIVASADYEDARDADDEGIFSTPSNDRTVSVILQGNVNTISDYMFSGVQMHTIWIPREVTSIGEEAFEDCSKLYGVTLAHSTPPTLGDDAFDGTLLQDEDEQRWIALEDATNINDFKTAPNWSEYADIIKPQL